MNYDNKRSEKDPVINADKASDLAVVAYGYHTGRGRPTGKSEV